MFTSISTRTNTFFSLGQSCIIYHEIHFEVQYFYIVFVFIILIIKNMIHHCLIFLELLLKDTLHGKFKPYFTLM